MKKNYESLREGKSYKELKKMENGKEKAIFLAVEGLLEDGAHHKQWYLEKILVSLGVDLKKLRKALLGDGDEDSYDWEDGIAP